MNIHPVFVHFPIALLTVYAILECLRFRKLTSNKSFFYIKAFLAVVGSLATYAALYTGGLAEDLARQNVQLRPLIDVHSTFAGWTTFVFTVVGVSYLCMLLEERHIDVYLNRWLMPVARIVMKSYVIIPLAVIGLVLITITGALGGLMVYGAHSDPFVSLVARIFFPGM